MHKKSKIWTILKTCFIIVVASVAWLPLSKATAQTYYLGVLAPQGETAAQNRWQPWLDELNDQLSDDTVILVPLALENWQQQIEAQQFALVLGPQVQFIKMNTIRWRWLATLQTETAQLNSNAQNARDKSPRDKIFSNQGFDAEGVNGQQSQNQLSTTVTLANEFNKLNEYTPLKQPSAMEEVASALWVAADSDIYRLQDLEQRHIAAVDTDAFGGYLLGAHLLQQNGITPSHYQTQFVGYPIERTLHALASGKVDAAITPLCLMEEMARRGQINDKQYRLIHPVATVSSCHSSTKIYPNWTLAATEQAPDALVRQINQHLFGKSQAEQRWLPAESSSDAERILYEMNRHPAQKQLSAHMIDWIKAHRLWMAVIILVILISTVNYAWMSWLAWRRQKKIVRQNRLIRDYDQQLHQSERFAVIGEMSGAIAHEINQPLATIQNYAQGLLIRSQHASLSKNAIDIAPLDSAATENALQQIVCETERVAAVVTNIRRWAGRSQANETRVDIAAIYQQCILLLGEQAVGVNFWLASDYQHLTLPNLLLDQLLINSMTNAAQQGATNIMLRCQAEEHDGKQWLVLHLSDDAGGFDQAQLKAQHLPENLPSQYATQSTKAGGLGLGLMICQRLCKSLGGMMQLNNIDAEPEIEQVYQVMSSEHRRFKRSLNGKIQLLQTNANYQLSNTVGAQISFYLPLSLANNDEKL
ncbi:PhnD/SsuA/transferrin family substrate-binding protein [Psychrobacter immobilis]|uniref:PhnD/SsuA/transferrin family substrate-binding protein n=1 Tax=Psychrobacter immobilis TaxID=498 RepID=UPI0028E497C2|nr:PhnD/SsuA/transferrin family substrate-binding protein [Psychrobacter immobilis]